MLTPLSLLPEVRILKAAYRLVRSLFTHPLTRDHKLESVLRLIRWQAGSRLLEYPMVVPFIESTRLVIRRGMTGATGNLYVGLADLEEMSFCLHYLRDTDLFFDVGSNVGAYTVLAGGVVGTPTIAVEPIPETYASIMENVRLNGLQDKVTALNIGVGQVAGMAKFTRYLDTMNHVALPGESGVTVEMEVSTLDLLRSRYGCPALIKLDVEGWEWPVLKGASATLVDSTLKVIIIELNRSGSRYGFADADINYLLLGHGFEAVQYQPFDRALLRLSTPGTHNTIYVREMDQVEERLRSGRRFRVLSTSL